MKYAELEAKLIQEAEQWRSSRNHKSTIYSDNTPFIKIESGVKARAIKEGNKWMFRAIISDGFLGQICDTLQESVEHAFSQKKECENKNIR